ncbi:MAG TPA: DNA methyltransferase [Candidatus Saccharimonas sp.]|nr:DNA methyltransferase [Candidatus Saccharimonas sp.]
MIITVLGRQPQIGLAELQSLYGAVQPIGDSAALVDAVVEPTRLGGTVKLARPLRELPTTDWQRIHSILTDMLPDLLASAGEGKIKLGLSAYGLHVTQQQLFRSGLELKKIARASKCSLRVVPSEGTALNAATVLYNHLTGGTGIELNLIKNGAKTWIAQTTWVQNPDDYAARDFGRPKRDAFVGMLPPKLAQIMLNLAQVQPGQRVLDPFCGTGVVLQEATLMGCQVYGTDLQPRMIDFTRANLEWLAKKYDRALSPTLDVADATAARWQSPIDHVVAETYLGQPLSGLPKPEKLQQIITDCNTIITKFLQNLRPQLASGTRLCFGVPAWYVNKQFKHLPLLDRLEEMGYNRVRFTQQTARAQLIYHREDQIVARELLVVTVI